MLRTGSRPVLSRALTGYGPSRLLGARPLGPREDNPSPLSKDRFQALRGREPPPFDSRRANASPGRKDPRSLIGRASLQVRALSSSGASESSRQGLGARLEDAWCALGSPPAGRAAERQVFLVGEVHTLRSHHKAELALLGDLARISVEEQRPLLLLFEGLSRPIIEQHTPKALIHLKFGECPPVIANADLRLAPLEPSFSSPETLRAIARTQHAVTRTLELSEGLAHLVGRWIERPPNPDEVMRLTALSQEAIAVAESAPADARSTLVDGLVRVSRLLLELQAQPNKRDLLHPMIVKAMPSRELLEKTVALLDRPMGWPGTATPEELSQVAVALMTMTQGLSHHLQRVPFVFPMALATSEVLQGLLSAQAVVPEAIRTRSYAMREAEMARTIEEAVERDPRTIVMAVMGADHVRSSALEGMESAVGALRLEPKETEAENELDAPVQPSPTTPLQTGGSRPAAESTLKPADEGSRPASESTPNSAAGAATSYDHRARGWSALFELDRNICRVLGPTLALTLLSTGISAHARD